MPGSTEKSIRTQHLGEAPLWAGAVSFLLLDRPPAAHKMDDERDHCENDQDVHPSSKGWKGNEAQKPEDEKDNSDPQQHGGLLGSVSGHVLDRYPHRHSSNGDARAAVIRGGSPVAINGIDAASLGVFLL